MASTNIDVILRTRIEGIRQIKASLNEIKLLANDLDSDLHFRLDPSDLNKVIASANALEKALDEAFDVDLNTINIEKFNQVLKKTGYNIESLQADLSYAGVEGQKAFLALTGQMMQMGNAVHRTNKFLNELSVTMMNTVKWGVTSGLWNTMLDTTQQAYGYVKRLDSSLNDIRIVTGKSAEDMEKFAVSANNAAKALAVSTSDYTEGALIYYQQGLDDETAQTLTDITAKTSNVTNQSMEEVSEQLTAVWNGYQVANQAAKEGISTYERYVDTMAAVGAATATDLEELATGMSKVASAAYSMGVDFEQLNAQIATIVSVTRQAPESVGTALKTIYARMSDLKMGATDEDGLGLGDVSGTMEKMGISILDQTGNLRDMGVIIEEVAAKWDTWNVAQRTAMAQVMAGKRQYNNLIALFDSWDMYTETLEVATNAAGTLDEQQSIALESLDNKLQVLRTTVEDLYDNLFDEETIGNLVEGLTEIAQFSANAVEAIGGLNTILPVLGSIGLRVFSKQLGGGVSNFLVNLQNVHRKIDIEKNNIIELQKMFGNSAIEFVDNSGENGDQAPALTESSKELLDFYQKIKDVRQYLSEEEQQQYNLLLEQKVAHGQNKIELEQQVEQAKRLNEQIESSAVGVKFLGEKVLDIDNGFIGLAENLADINGVLQQTQNFGFADDVADTNLQIKQLLSVIEAGGNVSDKFKKKIKIAFKNLRDEGLDANQAIDLIRTNLRQLLESGSNIRNLKHEIDSLKDAFERGKKNFELPLEIKINASQVMNGIAALSSLASALQIVKNVKDIWNNEELTNWEKILEITIALTSAFAMLTSSIKGLGEGIKAFPKLMTDVLVVLGAMSPSLEKYLSGIQLAEGETLNFAQGIKGTSLALKDLIKKIGTSAAGLVTAHPIIAATVAVIGLLAGAYAAYSAHLEATAKATQEQAKQLTEVRKEYEETSNSLKELSTAYQDLLKQAEEQSYSAVELKNRSYDLCLQYGQEELAVKSLGASYEQLTELIKDANKEANERTIQKAQEEQSKYEESFYASMAASNTQRGFFEGDWGSFLSGIITGGDSTASQKMSFGTGVQFNYGMGPASKKEENFFNDLMSTIGIEDANIEDGVVDLSKYSKEIAENWEDIQSVLTRYEGQGLSSHNIWKTFNRYFSNIEESIQTYKESIEQTNELLKQNIIIDTDTSDVNDASSFENKAKAMALEAVKKGIYELDEFGNPEEEALKWARSYLSTLNDEFLEYAQTNQIILELQTKDNFKDVTREELEKELEDWSNSDKAFLTLHVDLIDAYNSLEDFRNAFEDSMKYHQASASAETTYSILTDENNKEAFTEDSINNLYSGTNFEASTGVAQEQFVKNDYSIQKALMIDYYMTEQQYRVKNREQIKADLEEELNNYDKATSEITKKKEEAQNYLKEIIEVGTTSASDAYSDILTEDKINNLFNALKNGNELTKEQEEILKALTSTGQYTVESIQQAVEVTSEAEKVEKQIAFLNSEIQSITEAYVDWEMMLEQVKVALTNSNKTIDNAQNAYKSLSAAVEEYNTNGHFSLDTIQSLIEMDSQYLATLNIENEQLSLNADLYKEITLAQLENQKVLAYEQLLIELGLYAKEEDNKVTEEATERTLLFAESMNAAGLAAAGSTAELRAYIAALDVAEGANLYSEKSQEAFKAYENRIKLINAAIDEVNSNNFEVAFSGSSEKDKEERNEELKLIEEEIDRYWELNKAIESVTNAIEDLDEKQSNLHGKELIASLKEENKLLDLQAQAYKNLAAEQQREATELRDTLAAYGVVFDAQGGVANYLAASQEALNTYNQAVANYNSSIIDEATFQAAERAYENFKSQLDRYEALYYEEMEDTRNQLEEIHRQQLENNLEAWEVEIQLKLDLSEMKRDWDDFFKDINEDFKLVNENIDATLDNLLNKANTYQGEDGTLNATIQAIKDVQAEIDKMNSGGQSDMFESISQAQEKLKELNEDLQSSALDMKSLWEEAWDAYLEGIDQAADSFDNLMDKYDSINNQIEYQKELIELLYGEEAYGLMGEYYDAQLKNTNAEINSLKQQADLWKEQYEQALALDEANGTVSEDTQKYYELWQEAQEGLNDKVIEYIELLQEDYSNTISDIVNNLEKSLTGGNSLKDVEEEWERLKEQSDKYFDNVERMYEISSLASKYEQSIANTSSLKNQQKLQDLYEQEIEYLDNKKNLTEYDMEVAEARYNIALKQIALEEAQNNKNKMKLVRGADGNWSYQYVADSDEIAKKQEELLSASEEYYRITKEGYEENLEDMMNAQSEYLDMVKQINIEYANDEETRARKLEELYETYFGEDGILTNLYAENEERRTNMADATYVSLDELYKADEENFERMTTAEQELIEGLKNGTISSQEEIQAKTEEICANNLSYWESMAQGMADSWNADDGQSVKSQVLNAYDEMDLATLNYQESIDELQQQVEQDFGEEGITGSLKDAQEETEELKDDTKQLCDDARTNLGNYKTAVDQVGAAWESVKQKVLEAIEVIKQYITLSGQVSSTTPSVPSVSTSVPSTPSGGGSSIGDADKKPIKAPELTEDDIYQFGIMNYRTGANLSKLFDTRKERDNYIGRYYSDYEIYGEITQGKNKYKQIDAYDTGGYTGDWNGGQGRLALLHSKELVLNANDTKNMLAAVNSVRQIASLGTSINQSIMNGISQMLLGLSGLGNYGNYSIGEASSSGDTIFEIQANFPNANDVESIREAIMSLPNLASQYIARNKK